MGMVSRKIRAFSGDHRRQITLTVLIVIGAAILVFLATLFIYNTTPHYTYKPINACDILPSGDASKYIVGQYVNNTTTPTIDVDGTATSSCSYTDLQNDSTKTTVLALAVRSAVNSKGVVALKRDFTTVQAATKGTTLVSGVGSQAYFTQATGQLNVLNGRYWLIVSYGFGETPQDNNLTRAVTIAHQVIANADVLHD